MADPCLNIEIKIYYDPVEKILTIFSLIGANFENFGFGKQSNCHRKNELVWWLFLEGLGSMWNKFDSHS